MKNRLLLFGFILSLLYPVAASALSANVYASNASGSADNPSNASGAPDNSYATLWYPPSGGSFELSVSGFTPPESGKRELSSVIIYMEYKKIGFIGDDQMNLKYSLGSKQGATSITFTPSSREGMETLLSMDISGDRTFSMDDLASLKITASTNTVSDPDIGQVDVDSIWVAIEAPEPIPPPPSSSSTSSSSSGSTSSTSPSGSTGVSSPPPSSSSSSSPSSPSSPSSSSTSTPSSGSTGSTTGSTSSSPTPSTSSSPDPESSVSQTETTPISTSSPETSPSQPNTQKFDVTSFVIGVAGALVLILLVYFLRYSRSASSKFFGKGEK